MALKYIVFKAAHYEIPVVFPDIINHGRMAKAVQAALEQDYANVSIVSAGFTRAEALWNEDDLGDPDYDDELCVVKVIEQRSNPYQLHPMYDSSNFGYGWFKAKDFTYLTSEEALVFLMER